MTLIPLTNREEIRDAFEAVVANLQDGATVVTRKVGWHGGGGEFRIYWREPEQFWFFVDRDREPSRYWCCFGTSNPATSDNLTIVGEINPTKEGINRRNAGFFLSDSYGKLFLAHSGKLGGGRKGIGKSAFLAAYQGRNVENIRWPDGKTTTAIVVAEVHDKTLPTRIREFLSTVERFKEAFSK